MTRKAMTPARRRRILEKHGERCHSCGAEGMPLEIDHWVPLFLLGGEDDDNLRPLCEPCHKRKTATENRVRGKINRLSGKTKKRKHKWPKGRKIPSRPFSSSKRALDLA